MRREGVFSSVITLEKSKNQKTKKQGSTFKKQGSTFKKQGSTLKKQGSTLKKSQGKEKMQFCGNSWVLRKTPQTGSFFGRKNLNLTPAFSFPKKKKILKMKKVERKTEIFFSLKMSFSVVFSRTMIS